MQRFLTLQPFVFERLLRIFSPLGGSVFVAFAPRYRTSDVSARCTGGGRGSPSAVRQRPAPMRLRRSPFYQLVFATDELIRPRAVAWILSECDLATDGRAVGASKRTTALSSESFTSPEVFRR